MSTLTRVADFDHQVTGVTVTPDGRIFVNFPRWTEDSPVSVAELLPGGALKPYPDEAWNSWRNESAFDKPADEHFVCVQAMVSDSQGGLWVIDAGAPGNERIFPGAPKLVRIDLKTDRVTRVLGFPEDVVKQGTYLNDMRLGPDGKTGYVTDSGAEGAIIVVDLEAGDSIRALAGHASTQVEKDVIVEVDGAPLRRPDGRQPMFASDGIAISNDGKTLYWQALTGRTLYSIDTAKLDRGVSEKDRQAAVQKVGTTHVADGMLIDTKGDLYLTSPGANAVTRFKDGSVEIVAQDATMRWPDTMSQGPDGKIYVTASHIQDTYWFKPGAPAAVKTALFCFEP
jgi:sugar lactone lactonase YvrE